MNDDQNDYLITYKVPKISDYLRLRRETGLSAKSEKGAEIGLKNSIFAVTVYDCERLIGMGRIIGDGGCFFQIVDIAVDGQYQGKGLGKSIMQELVSFLMKNAPEGAYVSLIADKPADKLYEKFGFEYTYPTSIGMFRKF